MKTKLLKIMALVPVALFLSACVGNNFTSTWNAEKAEAKSPLRLEKDDSIKIENSTRYSEVWAGKQGFSLITDAYKELTFEKIEALCELGKADFIGSRIIEYTETSWQEVWLYNDEYSLRDDGVSGITVLFEYDEDTDVSNTSFYGRCHTAKGESFVIGD